jgi:hypothetical protein
MYLELAETFLRLLAETELRTSPARSSASSPSLRPTGMQPWPLPGLSSPTRSSARPCHPPSQQTTMLAVLGQILSPAHAVEQYVGRTGRVAADDEPRASGPEPRIAHHGRDDLLLARR